MKNIYFLVLICFLTSTISAQITTNAMTNANQLAQQLVGPGVVVSNATLSGSYMNNTAGTFTATNSNIGIKSGIVLSSAFVSSIPGTPAGINSDATCATCNDSDLLSLAQTFSSGTSSMRDAVILEFDIYVIADTLKFNYVFASDEYPTFNCSSYNDVFGFFISGPGITGPYSGNSRNIALIPGTTTPVGINTINDGSGVYPPCQSNSQYYNTNNATSNTHIFNGFTTVLTAMVNVQPCQTYRLKLKIADANDQAYDSGVFIEEGSLVSTGIELKATTSVGKDFPYAIEGCNYGIFEFTKNFVNTSDYVIKYQVGGTATNGTDYLVIPDSVVIPANDTSAQVIITPTPDGIDEGLESVILYLMDPCSGVKVLDSAVVYINDHIEPFGAHDTTLCKGDSVKYDISGAIKYTWTPSVGVSNDTVPDPTIVPQETTSYILKTEVASCVKYDTITVAISPPINANAGTDTTVCENGSVQLYGSGNGTFYWAPNTTLDDGNSKTPIATPFADINYTLMIIDSAGCRDYDTVFVDRVPHPTVEAFKDTTICEGRQANLNAQGGATYSWFPAASLNDNKSAMPIASPIITTEYTVVGYDQNKCTDTAFVKVKVRPAPHVNAGQDKEINIGESISLDANSSGIAFSWNPGNTLDNANTLNPMASPEETTIYTITAQGDNGCLATDTVRVTVILQGEVFVPNAFTPNGDGSNDYFSVIARGVVEVVTFKVYNRWGEVIYETNDIDALDYTSNTSAGWDGTYKGEPQAAGIYTFVFIGKNPQGEELKKTGHVTLIR